MNRPTSITVISWILIATGSISFIATILNMNNPMARDLMAQSPMPIPLQYLFTFIGLSIMVVCGVVMLKGRNWGRLLYVIWSIIGFTVGILTSPMKIMIIPGLVVFLIILFFLFRPQANAFFARA